MPAADFLLVICYDIPSDRRRLKIHKALLAYGANIQKSVFECRLTPRLRDRMMKRIMKIIDPKEDRVRLYALCDDCVARTQIIGVGEITTVPAVYVV